MPLEKQVKRLGLEGRVEFRGNQKDVRPFLLAADMFVLPSKTEGISNALLEAMAAGVACLVTPVGGNLEVVVAGRHGLHVPVGDVQAWADALVQLGRDEALRVQLGEAARLRIHEKYDFEVVGLQYENLYNDLMNVQQVKVGHDNA
jgi:glycosyltransferase involved in cell wall biosynthesis